MAAGSAAHLSHARRLRPGGKRSQIARRAVTSAARLIAFSSMAYRSFDALFGELRTRDEFRLNVRGKWPRAFSRAAVNRSKPASIAIDRCSNRTVSVAISIGPAFLVTPVNELRLI
jgi:hypothetical protein